MKKRQTTRNLKYKHRTKLVAISTTYKKDNYTHQVVYLVGMDGQKIHTYDNISGFYQNSNQRIVHKVICYDDFFVLQFKHQKQDGKDPVETTEMATAFAYDGAILLSTTSKWNESRHLLRVRQEIREHEQAMKF